MIVEIPLNMPALQDWLTHPTFGQARLKIGQARLTGQAEITRCLELQ